MSPRVVAVVVAAGMGVRLGRSQPKALVPLGGEPLVRHAVRRLLAGGVDEVVVVHPAGQLEAFQDACEDIEIGAWVPGGVERTDSVRAGCAVAVGELRADVVAIHDAARALVPPSVVAATLGALLGPDASDEVVGAAPGLPVPDTLKRATTEGHVTATADRAGLWAVHTPQAFLAGAFTTALDWAEATAFGAATDDLGLFEAARDAGAVTGRLQLVRSHALAGKVTWPEDLAHAEQVLAAGLAPLNDPALDPTDTP